MDNIIKITQDDNVYLLRNERPELGDLSIYVNQTRTKVSGRTSVSAPQNCDTKTIGDDTWSHVKVEWMYEKKKIAFRSSTMYIDRTGTGTAFEVIRYPVEHIEMVVDFPNRFNGWINPTT